MIKRTFNAKLVQDILSDPILMRRSSLKNLCVFDPKKQKEMYYLLALEGVEIIGLLVFHAQNKGCYQGHINYSPKHWGKGLEKYTREGIKWMFDNADCKKIFAFVPDRFPEIKRHAILSGMQVIGVLTDSYDDNDTIYDQQILSVSK